MVIPEQNTLLTASKDKTVKIWKWNGQQFLEMPSSIRHLQSIHAVRFFKNGTKIITAGSDRQVSVWENN